MSLNIVIWNNRDAYQGKIDLILASSHNNNVKLSQYPSKDIDAFKEYLRTTPNPPDGIIHRNEHGLLQTTPDWLEIIKICFSRGIKPMSFDFGYFDHYKNWMVDMYDINGISSIYYEWPKISPIVDWDGNPSIKEYRDNLVQSIEYHKNKKPIDDLIKDEYVVIWTQWTTDLIKNCFYKDNTPIKIDEWVTKIIDKVRQEGLQPVLKLSPVDNVKPFIHIHENVPTYISRVKHGNTLPLARYRKNINAKLIAHAKYHVINCSSVSNELVLSDSTVVATGKSWFDNLGIFHEPKEWDNLLNIPSLIHDNRNKWINWWISRQCPMEFFDYKIEELYNKFSL